MAFHSSYEFKLEDRSTTLLIYLFIVCNIEVPMCKYIFIKNFIHYLKQITMKKIIIFFVFTLLLGIIFTSCSNNDDSSTSASVVGKWNFSKMSTVINGVASPEVEYDGNENGCPKDYLEFKSGGAYDEADYSGSACVIDINVGTWVQTGNTLTITEGGDVISVEIVSVSSSVLKVKASETDNGVTITVNITLTKA